MTDIERAVERIKTALEGTIPYQDKYVGVDMSDLRAILAENERLRAELAELRAWLDHY